MSSTFLFQYSVDIVHSIIICSVTPFCSEIGRGCSLYPIGAAPFQSLCLWSAIISPSLWGLYTAQNRTFIDRHDWKNLFWIPDYSRNTDCCKSRTHRARENERQPRGKKGRNRERYNVFQSKFHLSSDKLKRDLK